MLTVSRLCYLLILESGNRFISRDMAYSAGLLHDIGRWKEYLDGSDHALTGALLAVPILERHGFKPQEIELITTAISRHRNKQQVKCNFSLVHALQNADLFSRPCLQCTIKEQCKLPGDRPTARLIVY